MALSNVQTSSLDPSQLRPAGPPSTTPLGVQGGEGTGQMITQTPMQGPDGRTYVMQQVGNSAPSFISEGPDGGTISYQPGANGTYNEGRFDRRSFGQAVFGDKKLMTFLAVAAGGAAASGAFGAGGAGGTGLGGGTGATPGVVQGGTSGVGGLGGTGAAGAIGGASQLGGGGSSNPIASDANARYSDASMPNYGGEQSGASSSPFGWDDAAKVGSGIMNNGGLLSAGLGALAGGIAGTKDQTTSFNKNETTSQQMQGGMSQSTNSSMQGQTGLVDYAQGAGRAYAGMAGDTIAGKYLGQGLGTNPYAGQNSFLNGAMDNVARRMTDNYKNGVASQSMGQFAANGAFGGSAHQQFMEGQNRAFGDSLGSTLNQMQMQDYTQQQQLAENQLNRNLQQFQGERQNMMNASAGLGNLGSTQSQNSSQNTTGTNWQNTNGTSNMTGTSTTPGVGALQGAIGGGLAGWGMYNQATQPNQGLGMMNPQSPYMQQQVRAY